MCPLGCWDFGRDTQPQGTTSRASQPRHPDARPPTKVTGRRRAPTSWQSSCFRSHVFEIGSVMFHDADRQSDPCRYATVTSSMGTRRGDRDATLPKKLFFGRTPIFFMTNGQQTSAVCRETGGWSHSPSAPGVLFRPHERNPPWLAAGNTPPRQQERFFSKKQPLGAEIRVGRAQLVQYPEFRKINRPECEQHLNEGS